MSTSRVVLITGATQNTGLTMARTFARHGDRVVVNGRSREKAEEAAAAIRADGGLVSVGIADVSDSRAFDVMVDAVVRDEGGIDVLVHSATFRHHAPIEEISDDNWASVMATTLTGAFVASRAVVPFFKKQKSGNVIFIGGHSAQSGMSGATATSAAKAGLIGLTKSLARELALDGVRVNCLSPGYVRTDRDGDSDARAEGRVPMGRLGTQEEIADTAWFLASPEAGYITGQVISVNGGVYT